jgi:tetratricopeptide (TPR) repeat protein
MQCCLRVLAVILSVAFVFSILASAVGSGQSFAQVTGTTSDAAETSDTATELSTDLGTTPSRDSSAQATESDANPALEQSELEEQFLSEKLSIIREYHDTLIETVHWALGTVVILAIAVLGFVWFAFNRSFDREKESLQAELRGELQSDFATESQKLRETTNLSLTTQNSKIANLESDLGKRIQSVEQISESLPKTLQNIADKAARNTTERMYEDVRQLRLDLAFLERSHWESRGIWSNALNSGLKLLELSMSLKKIGWYYENALEHIEEALKKVDDISEFDCGEIEGIISGLPKDFQSKGKTIVALAKTKILDD